MEHESLMRNMLHENGNMQYTNLTASSIMDQSHPQTMSLDQESTIT